MYVFVQYRLKQEKCRRKIPFLLRTSDRWLAGQTLKKYY